MMRVKICGLTRGEDARLAVELGAWAVGFICWPGSPRYIDPRGIRAITTSLPADTVCVGVFVDQPAGHIRKVGDEAGLTSVQLHGQESISIAQSIGRPVLKAVHVRPDDDPQALSRTVAAIPEDVTVLLDTFDPVRHGGTGQAIDWSLAATVANRRPVVLAGGLNPANVGEAIRQVRPFAVDVSSGVETSPGVKDAAKLHALFEAIAHD